MKRESNILGYGDLFKGKTVYGMLSKHIEDGFKYHITLVSHIWKPDNIYLASDNLDRGHLWPKGFDIEQTRLYGSLKDMVDHETYLLRKALKKAIKSRGDYKEAMSLVPVNCVNQENYKANMESINKPIAGITRMISFLEETAWSLDGS